MVEAIHSGGNSKMRTVAFYLYFFGYLFYSIPFVNKIKKRQETTLSVEEQDKLDQVLPKRWASTLVKISGANVTVTGEENIPDGPVLFVSNHEGNFDIPILISGLKKPLGFISKIEVKKIPVVSKWMEVMHCVFMDRKDRRQSIKAIRQGIELIKQGHSIVVFPEGTRSQGGPVQEFKAGSLRLGTDAKVPIVPVAIKGTSTIMEKNKGWIKPGDVTISILPALTYEEYSQLDAKEMLANIQTSIIEARGK